MRRFVALFNALDATNSTQGKVDALRRYLQDAPPHDAAWGLYFLTGRRLKRLIPSVRLREWTSVASGLQPWLVEECYAVVGDLAETVALLAGGDAGNDAELDLPLHQWVEQRLLPLREADEDTRREQVTGWWRALPPDARFVLNKLLTGALRVGVSRRLVVRGLAQAFDLEPALVAQRLMGDWVPGKAFFERLVAAYGGQAPPSQPYPFFLASPLDGHPSDLGRRDQWQAEWKWDGIRAQVIRRQGQTFVWSRGEELMAGRFPEIETAADALPDGTVLDGEVLAWQGAAPLPFAALQRRIGRLKPGATLLREAPVVLMVYDLIETGGEDVRHWPQQRRRRHLEALAASIDTAAIRPSPLLEAGDWQTLAGLRERARVQGTEGLMLKRNDSPYRVGRVRGDWWKWKVDPYTVDAVLMYAQAGHGRRSGLYTDYTFGVWRDDGLVPIAKAYSGLDNAEIEELDRWIRAHTLDRHGPVRVVQPLQVFELAFEGLQRSRRHKSGVAVRFPRIHRWRRDLAAADADTLPQVHALLARHEQGDSA